MLKKFVLLMGATSILCLALSGYCFADSSCVTCHTDEDMLEENLAVAKGAKSAMQSGAG